MVLTSALTGLQRSLLLPDLERLSGPEWRHCLDAVLFPLLHRLLEPLPAAAAGAADAGAAEETRMRACTLLCKVGLLLPLVFSFLPERIFYGPSPSLSPSHHLPDRI